MEKELKKEDACCGTGCCPDGCACGDCSCCNKTTQGSVASAGGCTCCSRFRNCCWVCKIGKVLFGLLILLALVKLAFGGWMGHRMGMKGGCGMNNNKGGMMMMDKKGAMRGDMMDKKDMQTPPADTASTGGIQ